MTVDGILGPEAQAGLRAAFAEQEQELLRRPARRRERRPRAGTPRRRPESIRQRRPAHVSALPMAYDLPVEDREVEREIDDVVSALRRRGSLSRREIRDEVNARLWGPGRLRHALRTAEHAGVVRRVGRDRWSVA